MQINALCNEQTLNQQPVDYSNTPQLNQAKWFYTSSKLYKGC